VKSFLDIIFVRHNHVCPWYCCFTFDNFFRRWLQNPYKIISQYIEYGDTVIDVGPGQGYFSIPMAKIVGEHGRIIVIDIQQQMLDILRAKAERAGVAERITYTLVRNANFGLKVEADFILAFWMVHEVPDKEIFFTSIYAALKQGKKLLIAEPYLHVSKRMMEETIHIALKIGFRIVDKPTIFFSRSIVLVKE
jgi:ubiquinone/menaquinone biosynthesis C-methylase UbiE